MLGLLAEERHLVAALRFSGGEEDLVCLDSPAKTSLSMTSNRLSRMSSLPCS